MARFLFLGLMVLTVAAAAAAMQQADPGLETAAVPLRLALAGLLAYLWAEWVRAERRAR